MSDEDPIEWSLLDSDFVKQKIMNYSTGHLAFTLNEPGSGMVNIPAESAASLAVSSGMFVRSNYRGAPRSGFFVDNFNNDYVAEGNADGGLWMKISGRGELALLEDAIVFSQGSNREFAGASKASMLITLINEAHARDCITYIDYDFSAMLDTDGNSWTDEDPYTFNAGINLLEVVRKIAKFGIDFKMEWDGSSFILKAYKNGIGTDKSSTIFFRTGKNCEVASLEERSLDVKNALVLSHQQGYSVVKDDTSINTLRRREKFIDARNAQSSISARNYGAALLEFSKDPKRAITIKVYDGVAPNVFIDYNVGDTISFDVKGSISTYRILGIQCDFVGSDYSNVTVELNSLLYENEITMSQRIDDLLSNWNTAREADLLEVRQWVAPGDVVGSYVYDVHVSDAGLMYVVGDFEAIGNIEAQNVAVYNIRTGVWSPIGIGFNQPAYSVISNGTAIYFGGDFTDANGESVNHVCTVTEGSDDCYPLGAGLVGSVKSLALDGSTLWASQYTGISKFDGFVWTEYAPGPAFADGITNVYKITIDAGVVYIGGQCPIDIGIGEYGSDLYKFTIAGTTWAKLQTVAQPSASVHALKVINGYLYVGGVFLNRNSVADTESLAKMNVSSLVFSSVATLIGQGVILPQVHSIIQAGADILFGGYFISAEGVEAENIFRFDGETITTLEEGLSNGVVKGLAVDNTSLSNNIFAVGYFTESGDKPIVKIGEYIANFDDLIDYLENSNNSFDMAAAIHVAPSKVPMVDDDEIGFWNSVTSKLAKISWANFLTGLTALYVALTGDQTVAGVKTFTSDPIIPDEAYDATAWNGSLEPPTKNAVKDKIESLVPATYTANRLLITDSLGVVDTSDEIIFDEATHILTFGEVVVGSIANLYFSFVNGASSIFNLHTWGVGFASAIKGVFARGSKASPTAVLLDDPLMKFRGGGYDGTTAVGSSVTAGEIRVVANQNFSNTAHGTRVEVWITPDGSTTLTKAITIRADGSINIESGKKYLVNGVDVLAAKQDYDSDLQTIAAIVPSSDDIIQRKSGAWVRRTVVQYLADLASGILGLALEGLSTATNAVITSSDTILGALGKLQKQITDIFPLVTNTDTTARTYTAGTWYDIGSVSIDSYGGQFFDVLVAVQYDEYGWHQLVGAGVYGAIVWKNGGTQNEITIPLEVHNANDITCAFRLKLGNGTRIPQIKFNTSTVVSSGGHVKIHLRQTIRM